MEPLGSSKLAGVSENFTSKSRHIHHGFWHAGKVLFRLQEKNVQFSLVILEIDQLFKIRGHVLMLNFETNIGKLIRFHIHLNAAVYDS